LFVHLKLARSLETAFASASELEDLALLSRDLELFDSTSHHHVSTEVEEVKRMLFSFIQKRRKD
jgi:four helix bundle protein